MVQVERGVPKVIAVAPRRGKSYKLTTHLVPPVEAAYNQQDKRVHVMPPPPEPPPQFSGPFHVSPAVSTLSNTRILNKLQLGNMWSPETLELLTTLYTEKKRVADNITILHATLGHCHLQAMQALARSGKIDGLVDSATRRALLRLDSFHCDACAIAKMTKKPVPGERQAAHGPLSAEQAQEETISSDVAGPFVESRARKYRYFAVFVHQRSRFAWVEFMHEKSEIFDIIKKRKTLWDKCINGQVVWFLSDNGGEYTSDKLREWFKEQAVQQKFSAPDTSAQNGIAERYIRTLRESASAMLKDAALPLNMWAEAVHNANTVLNHRPRGNAFDETPYEQLHFGRHDLGVLERSHPFGCQAFSHIPKTLRVKFGDKARECANLGCSVEHKDAWRLLHLASNQVIVSRTVTFVDAVFPSRVKPLARLQAASPPPPRGYEEPPAVDSKHAGGIPEPLPQRRSARVTAAPAAFDPAAYEAARRHERAFLFWDEERSSPELTLLQCALQEERDERATYEQAYSAVLKEPKNLAEARASPDWDKWLAAIQEELRSHGVNGTWDPALTSLPSGHKAVFTKWCFKLKCDEFGNPKRYKARLVVRGDMQSSDTYGETFSPTARWETIRTFIARANALNLEMSHLDVVTAFLYPTLNQEETVYIYPPEMTGASPRGSVLRLCKSMYGLVNAAAKWNRQIDATLRARGYQPSAADPCLYVHANGSMLLLYVDDILTAGTTEQIADIADCLRQNYKITDDGEPRFFLGVKIERDRERGTVKLSQQAFVEKILQTYDMVGCKRATTPMARELNKSMSPQTREAAQLMQHKPYKAAVGSLMYLAIATRPDIAYAVNQCAKFSAHPGPEHWSAITRIIRYISGTAARGLVYRRNSSLRLVAYADASDAGDVDTRRSVSGYCFMYGGAPVAWKSKSQKSVALSTAESELMSLTAASQEALWFRKLLQDFGAACTAPTPIYEDNNAAKDIATNAKFSNRTKHIARRHFFVQEHVQSGSVVVQRCDTANMIADLFTKALALEPFARLTVKLWAGRDDGK